MIYASVSTGLRKNWLSILAEREVPQRTILTLNDNFEA